MRTTCIVDFAPPDGITDTLTELLRARALQLIARAVQAEREGFMVLLSTECPDAGHAAGVRNGPHPARPFQTGIDPVSVRIPKVRSKNGQPAKFWSARVPPFVRKTKTLEAALPWLYLNGISSGEIGWALKDLLGSDAKGLPVCRPGFWHH